MVKYPVMKELKVTANEMLRLKIVINEVTSYDELLQSTSPAFERRVETFRRQPAVPRTASRKNQSRNREKHERGSKSSGKTSSRKTCRPIVTVV